MPVDIRIASPGDAALVAEMATALTGEIIERTGVRHFNVNRAEATQLCSRLITDGCYIALLARDGASCVGLAGLCESYALYAEGRFGIVQEFYVVPGSRSSGIGGDLLKAAAEYGRSRGWRRLELCTPPLPEFARSLEFYERNGFEVTGGRKMKHAL